MRSIGKRIWLMIAAALACVAMFGLAVGNLAPKKAQASGEAVTYSADWYTLSYDGDEVEFLLNADYHNWKDFSLSQADELIGQVKEIASSIVEDKLLFAESGEAAANALRAPELPFELDEITGANVSGLLEEFLKGDPAEVEETVSLVLDGSYDNLLNYAVDKVMDYVPEGYTAEDVKQGVTEIVSETLAGRVSEETIAALNEKLGETVVTVSETEEPFTLGVRDVLNAVESIVVDGKPVYTVGEEGSSMNAEGVKAMLGKIPRPSEIAGYGPDDPVSVSYDVIVDTMFGDIAVKATAGLEGDTAYVRKACEYIAKVIDVVSEGEGYTVTVNVPEISAGRLLRLTTTGAVSDEVKDLAFKATDMTPAELNAYIQDLEVSELQSLLKGIDYQSAGERLLDAEWLSSVLGVNITQERLDKALDYVLAFAHKDVDSIRTQLVDFLTKYLGEFEVPSQIDRLIEAYKKIQPKIPDTAAELKELVARADFNERVAYYIDKIDEHQDYIDAAKRALQKLMNVLPERLTDRSLFDLIDGERVIAAANGIEVSLGKIGDYIERLSSGFGGKVNEFIGKIVSVIGDPSVTVNFVVDLPLNGVHKITFVADETVNGLLPAGADLSAFGADTIGGKAVLAWVDENGAVYEKMPEEDVVLYAVTGFEASMAGVEKTYDGETAKLEVVTAGEGYAYTYAWKKDGAPLGETGSFIEIVNVADSGEYTCTVTGTGKYGEVFEQTIAASVSVAQAQNSVSDAQIEGWTYGETAKTPSATAAFGTAAFRYFEEDGTTAIDGVPENAGSYYVQAYVAADAAGNYTAAESKLVPFAIAKAGNSITLMTADGWTYDGTAHAAAAAAAYGTPVLTYYTETDEPLDGAPKNAGVYYAVATVAESENYTGASKRVEFTVAQRELDFADADWNALTFTYDGEEKSVSFDKDAVVIVGYTGELDFGFAYKDGADYDYAATDAGSYKAGFTFDNVNFKALNLGEKDDVVWTVAKAAVSVDKDDLVITVVQDGAAPSEELEVTYNGKEYTVQVSGLPAGVVVTMSGDYKKTEAGSYTAVATFAPEDDKNYTLSGDTEIKIEWSIAEGSVVPPEPSGETQTALDGAVEVTDNTGAADGYDLAAEDVSATLGDVDLSGVLEEGQKGAIGAAYDIHFEDGGAEKPVSGNFTVRLLIPEDLRSAENLMVIHIADDGAVTAVDATRDGNYMEFTVNGFSVYAVVEVTEDVPEGGNWWIYVLIAVAVIIIVIVIILLLRRKKDEGDGEPAPEEEKTEEPAEEPAQEEEETQEAQEESAAESEEPAPEEPEEEPEEPDEPDGAALAAAADAAQREVYDRSYYSRLAQADDEVKNYYYEVRNRILSYRKMTNRISWNYESFNRGRMQCIKLKVRGKALVMYIALDPNELNVNKYHHQDVSDKAKYAEVPTMMKIRSPRGMKYALELIDMLLAGKLNLGLKKVQPEPITVEYESDEALLEKGYIKVQYTSFGFGKD